MRDKRRIGAPIVNRRQQREDKFIIPWAYLIVRFYFFNYFFFLLIQLKTACGFEEFIIF